MTGRIGWISLFCLWLLVLPCQADIVVVVNPQNPVAMLGHRELVDIYMGRTQHFPNGALVLRLDQAPDSAVREAFYRALVNKSVGEVKAYWAKMLFTGRASPPQVVDSSTSVLNAVRENANAIGYLDSADVDGSVRIVGRVD